MGWILRLPPGSVDADVASSVLWDQNTTGIAEVDPGGRPGRTDAGAAVVAGFATRAEAEAALRALRRAGLIAPGDHRVTVEATTGAEWADPTRTVTLDLGREVGLDSDPAPGAADIDLDGIELLVGRAFGDGRHASTRLAVALVRSAVVPGSRFCDFGTGTGLLALVAAASGATRLAAIDDDAAARAVAAANLARLVPPDRAVVVTDRLRADAEPFDVVAANVLAPVHRAHGRALAGALTDEGALIVSGVLVDQQPLVESAYPGLRVVERLTEGEWLGLVLER